MKKLRFCKYKENDVFIYRGHCPGVVNIMMLLSSGYELYLKPDYNCPIPYGFDPFPYSS